MALGITPRMAYPAKVGDKLRVYLPQEIADALKLKKGDYIVLRIEGGKVTLDKLK